MNSKEIFRLTTSPGGLERLLPTREAEVMRLFWRRGAQTVREIYEEISARRDVAYTTVMTTCLRLADKGLLHREREAGISYRYMPTSDEHSFVAQTLAQLLDGIAQEYPYVLEEYIVAQGAR